MGYLIRNLRSAAKLLVQYRVVNINLASVRTVYQTKVFYGVSRTGFEDYEKERASWCVKIPEKFNFAADVLDVWAQKESVSSLL